MDAEDIFEGVDAEEAVAPAEADGAEAGPADGGVVGGGGGAPEGAGGGHAGEAPVAEVAIGGGEPPAADLDDGAYGDAPAAVGGVWAAAAALGDAAGDERAAMVRRQRELKDERRRLQMDMNNANRRRGRVIERARGLTDADLLDILAARAAAKAKAKANAKAKAKAAAKGKAKAFGVFAFLFCIAFTSTLRGARWGPVLQPFYRREIVAGFC